MMSWQGKKGRHNNRHSKGRSPWWQKEQHQESNSWSPPVQSEPPVEQQPQQSKWFSWKPQATMTNHQHTEYMPKGGSPPMQHYYALKEAEDRRKKKKEQKQLGKTLRKSLTKVRKKSKKKKKKSRRGSSSSSSG